MNTVFLIFDSKCLINFILVCKIQYNLVLNYYFYFSLITKWHYSVLYETVKKKYFDRTYNIIIRVRIILRVLFCYNDSCTLLYMTTLYILYKYITEMYHKSRGTKQRHFLAPFSLHFWYISGTHSALASTHPLRKFTQTTADGCWRRLLQIKCKEYLHPYI